MDLTEIGKEFYHFKSAEPAFHRNIYVKRFVGADGASRTIVFDPGAKPDAPALWDALAEIAGGVENVDLVFLSHQDPDVISNAKFLIDNAPEAVVLASVDSWRLLCMTGIPDNRFYLWESRGGDVLEIKKTGHRVQLVPAYYCHFRGSIMLYDLESRVLFSGDFLGGVNTRKGSGVHADEASWEGIARFHQIYVPTQRAVQETIGRIASLEPPPEVIAPQHGDVIRGVYVKEFLSRLATLDVGVDLVKLRDPERERDVAALNAFFDGLRAQAPSVYDKLWREITRRNEFTTVFVFSDGKVADMKVSLASAAVYLCNVADRLIPYPQREKAKIIFSVALEDYGLKVPAFCLGGVVASAVVRESPRGRAGAGEEK